MLNTKLIPNIIILLLGICAISFGAALFILSNIGSDPFNVFMQGLSNVGGLSIGQFNVIVSFIYVVIIFFWDRTYLKLGTLISLVTLGPGIDYSIYLLEPLFSTQVAYWIKFVSMMIGSCFISFGVALIYSAKIGMVPNDTLPVIMSDKLSLPFKWVRVAYDVSVVIIGVILGGIFGIGTIFCALATGPLIAFFLPYVEKMSAKTITKI